MGFDLKLALAIGVTVVGAAAVDSLSKSIGGLGAAGRKAGDETGGFGKSLDGIGGKLASLVGGVASVSAIATAFSGLTQAGFQANSALETNKLGIASLITAQADLVGAYNRTLKGTDALGTASDIAADQMQKLKIAGLQTAATTDQLTEAFQQAVGAGLNAGLKLDDIRNLTVGITQAAGALGVPMQQLNQEVVSILAGTIDINSRVAKSLGISNEMVASWKEQGVLAQKLGEKLQAFTISGGEIAKTWAATKSNMVEAFSELARVVTGGAFDRIKTALGDALSGLFNLKDASVASWLQPITDGMKRIFDALGGLAADAIGGAVDGARTLADWLDRNRIAVLDMGSSIADAGREIGAMAKPVGDVILGMVDWSVQSGIVNGLLRTASLLLAGFQDGVKLIGNAFASVGADIMEFGIKPLVGFKDLLSGKGWGGSEFYATLTKQIRETRQAVAETDAAFAVGRTSVGDLMSRWNALGDAQEQAAKKASTGMKEVIAVQVRAGNLTREQNELAIEMDREQQKRTLSATEFAINEAERAATKRREKAAGNAELLKRIEEDLQRQIAEIRAKELPSSAAGLAEIGSLYEKAAGDRKALAKSVVDDALANNRTLVDGERNAAKEVAAVWSQANAVKAQQTGGAIMNQGTPGEFVSSWDANGNYVGDLGSTIRYADGGPIAGPGNATSDSILARLSNGEFVMRAAAVQRYGMGFMDAINRMALPRFADGGAVRVGAGGAASGSATGGIVIQNLNLPNVGNARQFVAELKQMLRTDPGLLSAGMTRAG